MNMKRAWTVALVTIFAGVALALVQNKVAPCMVTLQNAFGIDMASAGWLSSLFSLVGIIMAIPASIILNKLGPKKSGILALVCAIAGSLIGIFAGSVALLMASRVIEGIGVGLISVIGFLPDVFMSTLCGSLLDAHPGAAGYTAIFYAMLVFGVVGLIMAVLLLRQTKKN